MANPTFSNFAGVRNTVPPERLHSLATRDNGTCDLAEAVNVTFDNSGQVARRAGLELVNAGAAHSLWAQGDMCLFVRGTSLYRLYPDFSVELVASGLTANAPMAYLDVVGRIYWTNEHESGVLADGRSRSWGMEIPAAPGVSVLGAGALDGGQYMVTITHVRSDSQESGAGLPVSLALDDQQGLRVTWSDPGDPDIELVRVYLSTPNGMVMYVVAETPIEELFTEITSARFSLPLNSQWQDKPPVGQCLTLHRGRIWIAQGEFIFPTTALGYEYVDMRDYLAIDGSRVRMMAGLEGGTFVGTDKACWWVQGARLEEYSLTKVFDGAVVAGTLAYVDGAVATGNSQLAGRVCAVFASETGIWLGMPDGTVTNLTLERFAFDVTAQGAGVYHQNQLLNQYVLFLQS